MLRFDKATYSSLLFRLISSVRLSNSSFLYYTFFELIILLYTFLVISFSRCIEYITCLISFSKFPDVLPVFYLC